MIGPTTIVLPAAYAHLARAEMRRLADEVNSGKVPEFAHRSNATGVCRITIEELPNPEGTVFRTYPARSAWGLKLRGEWLVDEPLLTVTERPEEARRFNTYDQASGYRDHNLTPEWEAALLPGLGCNA